MADAETNESVWLIYWVYCLNIYVCYILIFKSIICRLYGSCYWLRSKSSPSSPSEGSSQREMLSTKHLLTTRWICVNYIFFQYVTLWLCCLSMWDCQCCTKRALGAFFLQLSLKYVCVMMMASIFLSEGDRPADEVSQRRDIQMTHCGSGFFGRPALGIRRHWALNPWPLLFIYLFLV